jgi:hypothetical protein
MKRVGIGILAAFLLLSSVTITYLFIRHELNTAYANPNVKQSFKTITTNATLDEVYAQVGRPLFVDVNFDRFDGGYSVKRDYIADIRYLRSLMDDPKVSLRVTYSAAKPGKNDYWLYAADICQDRVYRIKMRVFQD